MGGATPVTQVVVFRPVSGKPSMLITEASASMASPAASNAEGRNMINNYTVAGEDWFKDYMGESQMEEIRMITRRIMKTSGRAHEEEAQEG